MNLDAVSAYNKPSPLASWLELCGHVTQCTIQHRVACIVEGDFCIMHSLNLASIPAC